MRFKHTGRERIDEGVSGPSSQAGAQLIAYRVNTTDTAAAVSLVPAAQARAWMAATPAKFARRCLPLLIANQAGWCILNRYPVRATWNGTDAFDGVSIEPLGPVLPGVMSHFGSGILTWNLPYLFRTPPGYNLLVRGPANWPKDGASALEGIVETDWSPATFTMNWKLTRPHWPVEFKENEPICMLVPQRRGELEAFRPAVQNLSRAPWLARLYERWSQSRYTFLRELHQPGSEAQQQGWQRDYLRGVLPDGERACEHQTHLTLQPFSEEGDET